MSAEPLPALRPTPDRRIQTVCLLLLTAVALGGALYFLRTVLIPFVLAILFLYCLAPAIDFQRRVLRLPRMLALVGTGVLGLVLLLLLGHLVRASADQIARNAPSYEEQLVQLVDRIAGRLPLERLGLDRAQFDSLLDVSGESVRSVAGGLLSSIMSVLSNGVLVVLFLLFLLLGRKGSEAPAGGVWAEIDASIRRYVTVKVALSAITGVLVGATLALLGVPFALVFGVLTFLLNFIPNLGSVVAVLLPLPVVLLSPEVSAASKVLAIVLPAALQFAIGNLLEPKMLGDSLGLHPIAILLGLMFFGMIWGIFGMLLAAPILAVLKIVLERISVTAPAASLLGGRLRSGARPPSGT